MALLQSCNSPLRFHLLRAEVGKTASQIFHIICLWLSLSYKVLAALLVLTLCILYNAVECAAQYNIGLSMAKRENLILETYNAAKYVQHTL